MKTYPLGLILYYISKIIVFNEFVIFNFVHLIGDLDRHTISKCKELIIKKELRIWSRLALSFKEKKGL